MTLSGRSEPYHLDYQGPEPYHLDDEPLPYVDTGPTTDPADLEVTYGVPCEVWS